MSNMDQNAEKNVVDQLVHALLNPTPDQQHVLQQWGLPKDLSSLLPPVGDPIQPCPAVPSRRASGEPRR